MVIYWLYYNMLYVVTGVVKVVVKVSFTVRIEKELYDKLVQKANELGISRTKLVEKIIADYFNYKLKEDPLLPLQVLQKKVEELEKRIAELEKRIKGSGGLGKFIR